MLHPQNLVAALALVAAPVLAQDEDSSPIAGPLEVADAALDAIAAIPDDQRTYENTLRAIDDVVARLFNEVRMVGFMGEVSTDPDERARGRRARNDLSNFFDRLNRHEGLYEAVRAFAATDPVLDQEAARFLEQTLRDFRREGMELGPDARERLAEIDEEITELGDEFRRNIADDETVLVLSPEELAGVPARFLSTVPRAGDLYLLDMKGPSLSQVLGYCDVEETRKKVGACAGLRGGSRNVEVLEELLELRHEKARLLGYPTYAHYEMEPRMAHDPETVWAFYDELRPKLRKKAERDFAEFEAAKREHTGDPQATLQAWDFSYYRNWLLRERYAVDTREVREYFPLASVERGMFDVYQDLFGLTFEDRTEEARAAGHPLWHEDVRLYRVVDDATGEEIGRFYLDLYPRPGKYSHAAQFPLELRKVWADGTVTNPLVALVCNFTKPTEDTPSLLSHSEVETFFHEFGHCLHSILTEATLANLAGTAVARDFVEAPSQMLENWVWHPDVLSRFARHYETGDPLPKEIIDGMIRAKNLGSGLATEGQVFLGMMDLRYHTDEDGVVDTTAVRAQTYRDARMFEPMEGLRGQASFGHLVGYQAGYYGYLWSLVYAQDMWSRFAPDPMNRAVAADYRRKVLSRGGTVDELDMVRAFLDREPSADAFLRHLGLDEEY